jgi:hypothetical protein
MVFAPSQISVRRIKHSEVLRTRFAFSFPSGNENCGVAGALPGEPQSAGLWHLIGSSPLKQEEEEDADASSSSW